MSSRICGHFALQFCADLKACLNEEVLRTALQRLQRRHPKLRARIEEAKDGRLYYEFPNPSICVPYKIREYDGTDFPWRDEMRGLLESPFPSEGPYFSVVILRSRTVPYSELLMCSTHTFTDGLSALVLLENFLAEYAKAETNTDTSNDPILPCVTAGYARAAGGWRGPLTLLRRFMRLKRKQQRMLPTALPESKAEPTLSQWSHWVFSAEDTLKVVKRLRKEKTSLNAALMTAVSFGLMVCLPDSEALFSLHLPFNVREWLTGPAGPVSDQDLGCFITHMNGYLKLNRASSFFDVAREAQDDIQMFTSNGGPWFGYNMSSFFYSLGTGIRRWIRLSPQRLSPSEKQGITMLVNNYGVATLQNSYGSLRPKDCTLIFNTERASYSLTIQALVLGQKLNVGLAAGSLEPMFWNRLQNAVLNYLKFMMGSHEALNELENEPSPVAHAETPPHWTRVAAQE